MPRLQQSLILCRAGALRAKYRLLLIEQGVLDSLAMFGQCVGG